MYYFTLVHTQLCKYRRFRVIYKCKNDIVKVGKKIKQYMDYIYN